MSDLISRQDAIAVANRADYRGLTVEDVKKVTDEVVKGLSQLPSASTVEAVKHGRWIASDYNNAHIRYTCSNCGLSVLTNSDYIKRHRYCYGCGAKMYVPDINIGKMDGKEKER